MLLLLALLFLSAGHVLGLPAKSCTGDAKSKQAALEEAETATGTGTAAAVWQPAVGATWQIVLQSAIALDPTHPVLTPDVSIIDLDLFTNTNAGNDGSKIAALHGLGKKVICYFSAGSYEQFRPDANEFQASDLGHGLDGWPGERWLRVSSENVRRIMANRIAMAGRMGCDAIDPDNIDGYGNNNGLGLTQDDAIDYVEFLAQEAAKHNMAIGLKNAGEIIDHVLPLVHFSVNEECAAHRECSSFMAFVDAGKPVFHIEYADHEQSAGALAKMCKSVSEDGGVQDIGQMSTVVKKMELGGWVQFCDGRVGTTTTE